MLIEKDKMQYGHNMLRPLKNVQFCSRSRTIPQDSGIGQQSGCPSGRGAWTPRVNAKILTKGIHSVFRGLKFEADKELEQKSMFFKDLMSNRKGFTLLGVLAFLVVAGIALTAASKYWSTVIKREKEEELLFRGDQIKTAITSYYKNTPKGKRPSYPRNLENLLRDPRFLTVRRHLRKIYKDPVTEDGTWGLIRDSKGGVKGVFSKSKAKPIKTGNFSKEYEDFEKAKTYSDWKFVHKKEKTKKKTS